MINVAINGFGRIGRNFLRAFLQDETAQKKINIIAINIGPADLTSVAHMFKYDTLLGTYPKTVTIDKNKLEINGFKIDIISEKNPEKIHWHKYDIDWVVDATGKFTNRDGAQLHIKSGAKKVLITAPAKDEDVTIIPGVNDNNYDPKIHNIVSLGSCTTNALAPMLKVLHENFVIETGFMTTVHAYTNSQVLLDVERKDLRRARAAALNIIPTSTGATKLIGKIMPEIAGKIGGTALRIPLAKVSLIDLAFIAKKEISPESINNAFKNASQNSLKNILNISFCPLVSSDYSANNNSVIIDGLLTDANGQMGKVFGWYDNEWAYSVRLKDLLVSFA